MTEEARASVHDDDHGSGQPDPPQPVDDAWTGQAPAEHTSAPRDDHSRSGSHHGLRGYLRVALSRIPHDYMPGWVGPFWTWLIVAATLGRGTDLLFAPNEGRSEISAWVNVIGNNTYGWLFTISAVILIGAKISGRLGPVTLGIMLCAAFNLMYSIALFQGVFAQPGPPTGWRFAVAPFLTTVLCIGRLITLVSASRRVRP